MPSIPGPAGICGSGAGISTTAASVVKNVAATDAAFCNADLVTLVGSTIPALIIFLYSPTKASYPIPASLFLTFSIITEPSTPALVAICLTGSSNALTIILIPTCVSATSEVN